MNDGINSIYGKKKKKVIQPYDINIYTRISSLIGT